MSKTSRIKAFVDLEQKNNVISVQKYTKLFEKLLINVQNEYKRFHEDRKPKINNFEIALNGKSPSKSESSNEAGYLQNENFIKSFTTFKENQELPFSITQEIKAQNEIIQSEDVLFPSQHVLRTSYFVSNTFSRETFHQIQRQHKIWWMKYGASPGKYSISDQKQDSFYKFVSIRSHVGESAIDVERLKLFSLKDCIKDKEVLNSFLSRVPNRKKEVIPDVIETTVDLQIASLALLMDAVNLSDDYTAFHRRSAPYQIVLIVNGTSNDLIDMARYIELLVQATDSNIEILNESNSKINNQKELEKRFENFDKIGIPYTIILDDKALEAGLFKLRNRNTTLSETIHLSDVTNYLIKIFRSG